MSNSTNAELEEYIAGHVDEAIEKGWIKVYFQPVIRALTGRLSSCEALTRWADPYYGMISPGVFIPVLEKTNQIQKVDNYVIDYVAGLLKSLSEQGKELVPVSFNLSRVDFSQEDPYEQTEKVVAKHGIDRRLLKVEITESTLISDPAKLDRMFTLFHDKGYDIWMDDFGSGYSTLNVLKDYSFDEIKIDMIFLRGLNERGRSIISSIVRMAKGLGIQTLTEGAETREQVEFLRKIGCEKIQGYYFGAPMPYDQLVKHCFYFGLIPETMDEAAVYDAAGSVDFLEDRPVALIDSIDGELKVIFDNERSCRTLNSIGIPASETLNSTLENKNSSLFFRLTNFLNSLDVPGVEKTFNSVFNGHYVRAYIKLLKKVNGHSLFQSAVFDITYDISQNENRRFNDLLREANEIYKYIYLWSPKEDRIEVVSSDETKENPGSSYSKVKSFLKKIAEERLAEDDRERFTDFLNPSHVKAVLNRTHSNFIGECFKVKNPMGGYSWDEVDVLALKFRDYGDYLILERKAALEDVENPEAVIRRIDNSMRSPHAFRDYSEEDDIYRGLLESCKLKFFWKDKDRRFRGVSQAMLNYYGISSASEIIGKTDEEMGWHIDNGPYFDDEMQVIKEGRTVRKSPGHTLVGGQVKIISATKFPLYKGDEIVGLAGFFEEENTVSEHSGSGVLADPTTGFMNFGGFMLSLIYYRDNYIKTKEKYIVAYIHIDAKWMGKASSISDRIRLVKRISLSLSDKFTISEMICAMDDRESFAIITKEDIAKVREQIDAFIKDIASIDFIGSDPVKLSASYSVAMSEENIPSEQLIDVLKERCRQESDLESKAGADRFVLELEKLENMDERIYICDMESYDLLFVNKMVKKDLGLPEDFDCHGKKCYDLIHHYDHPCNHCTNPICTRGGFVSRHYHNTISGHDYLMRDTIINFAGKAAKLSMSVSLTENIREVVDANNLLYKRIRINDFVGDALEEASPEEGLGRMLENIGKEFEADRVYIFEEENAKLYNTYEWCADGVEPDKDLLQDIPLSEASTFYDEFMKNSSIVIDDVEKYHGTQLYNILKPQKIYRLISVPLKDKGEVNGFIGIDNPSAGMMDNADLTLNSLARFVSALIRNRNVLIALEDMSHHDQMTGAYNRAALKHVFYNDEKNGVTAIVYADVNGLKETNDKYGHKAGDELIMKAANTMARVAGMDKVFRMGGDEFVILLEAKGINEIDSRLNDLNTAFEKEGLSIAVGASIRTDPNDSLNKLLVEADERMYRNKKLMHKHSN